MKERIAIVTDSGSDVPLDLIQELGIFVAPLQVIYKDRIYRDGVDITPQEVYDHLTLEVPKTSLPQGDDITALMNTIQSKGFTHIIAVVLSSGLSGTYNLLRLIKAESSLPMEIVDTKNIGIGSGLSVIQAARMVKDGRSYDDILQAMPQIIENTKVFFVLNTLKYLELGGRIGKVSAMLGHVLDLKPIITCNEDGVYVTVAKSRGRRLSLNQCMAQAQAFLGDAEVQQISIAHGDALAEALEIKAKFQAMYPKLKIGLGPVSPALGVHTGPGLIGIAIQRKS